MWRGLRVNDSGGAAILQSEMIGSSSPSKSAPISSSISSPSSTAVGVGVDGGESYILHTVSKFDTLAGVAIKYGVEVSDIKRLNGLVTDLQMFARKTLHIPLPGRFPPSPSLPNDRGTPPRPSNSPQTLSSRRQSNLFDSFPSLKLNASSEQKVSPAMNRLQGYYGLRPSGEKGESEGFEMATYRNEGARYLEDRAAAESSPITDTSQSQSWQRKSKSTANLLLSENGNLTNQVFLQEPEINESGKSIEKLVRRRQKSEVDFTSNTPEKLLKEDNTVGTTISAITGKGLALRPKSASRTVSGGIDGEEGGLNSMPIGLGDSILINDVNSVQKSSSASSLLDSENGTLSSIWATSKWSLTPDFQALSSVSITSRRNKAALD